MTENAQDKARQAVETVVKSPELVEQILSDEYVQIMIARRFHSGPLPPPSDLAQYNDIISNGADRIMAMAEKEQAVRHETIQQDQTFNRRGQLYGFISVILILLLPSSSYGAATPQPPPPLPAAQWLPWRVLS